MKRSLIALAALLVAGCTSLNQAGNTAYTVRPFAVTGKDGAAAAVVCCELQVQDGKEYSGRVINFQTDGGGYALSIQEGESKAFVGQGIAAKAASVLPVTNLPVGK
jgi:hypothetical protein